MWPESFRDLALPLSSRDIRGILNGGTDSFGVAYLGGKLLVPIADGVWDSSSSETWLAI